MALADAIHNVTDYIEDVVMRMLCTIFESIKEHGGSNDRHHRVKCCAIALKLALQEFHKLQKITNPFIS